MIGIVRSTWNAMRSRAGKRFGCRRAMTHAESEVTEDRRAAPRLARCAGCAAALAASAAPAAAQVVPPLTPPILPPWNAQRVFEPLPYPQLWDRDSLADLAPEDTPVKTRQQPGYESVGVRAGSWMLHPAVTTGVFYDSNLFSTNGPKQAGLAAVVHPAITATSLWERHQVELQADMRTLLYPEHSQLDQTDARFRARGRIDVRHDIMILTRFEASHLHEEVGSLSSPAGAVEPTPYNFLSGDVTYRQEFDRLTVSLGGGLDSYDYGTTRAQDGTIIDQSSRDGEVYRAHGRLDYAVSPLFGLFSALEVNRRDLRGTPARPLGSDGYRSLSGVALQLSHLVSAELAAGYAQQTFDSPEIGTAAGPAYRAALIWSPTRLVDVRLQGTETVAQATDTDAASVRARAVQLGLDYEFRRNVVISLSGSYETDKFLGQDRFDHVFATTAELKYLIGRFGSIALQHSYVRRESTAPFANFDKHRVGINVTAQF
jgi:hypothetical protein